MSAWTKFRNGITNSVKAAIFGGQVVEAGNVVEGITEAVKEAVVNQTIQTVTGVPDVSNIPPAERPEEVQATTVADVAKIAITAYNAKNKIAIPLELVPYVSQLVEMAQLELEAIRTSDEAARVKAKDKISEIKRNMVLNYKTLLSIFGKTLLMYLLHKYIYKEKI